MLSNMAISLILSKRIETTLAKAKELRVYVEPLITRSKDDSTHSRRVVFSYLQDKEALKELFGEVAIKVADRPGGYTRIIKLGTRLGDNAEKAMIELVDFNEVYAPKEEEARKTRRSRRGAKKDATTVVEAAAPVAEEVVEAAPMVEEVTETPAPEAPATDAPETEEKA